VIGRLHHVVLDTRDPDGVAAFWSELLGLPVTYRAPDWVVVSADDTTSGLAFQLAPDHEPPRWPDPRYPQQVHLDVMVDDVEAAQGAVLALGARALPARREFTGTCTRTRRGTRSAWSRGRRGRPPVG
jgi:catechol 2,3-dioxygenase-like lactoylglutathione lyase family enzyme